MLVLWQFHSITDFELRPLNDTVFRFECYPKKQLYNYFVSFHNNVDMKDMLIWKDLLSFECTVEYYFRNSFNKKLTKRESDMIWRMLHGAIPTGRYLHGCRYATNPNCLFCGDIDDLTHIFVKCPRLSALFRLMQDIIRKLLPHIDKIPFYWYIIGIYNVNSKNIYFYETDLANWIIGIVKISIIHSRWNKIVASGTGDVLAIFKAKIRARLEIQYTYDKINQNTDMFDLMWNCKHVLCKIVNDRVVLQF